MCTHAPQRGPQDSLETGVCTSAAGSPAAARPLSTRRSIPSPGFMGPRRGKPAPSALSSGLCREAPCGGRGSGQEHRAEGHSAAGSLATWGFHVGSPDAPQEKRKGWDVSPKVSLKFKTVHSLASGTSSYSKITEMTPGPCLSVCLSVSQAHWWKETGGCSMLQGRGGCPAKGRVRAEGPERKQWEQEGHP